jgi:fermentation-respiration switch protein FrsA (DUF1100 family)
MLRLVHWVLIAWYLAGPILALAVAWRSSRKTGRALSLMSWLMTAITAVVLGTLLAFVYAQAAGGRMMISQAALAAYFAAGLLFLLKAFDHVLRWISECLFRVPRASPATTPRATDTPSDVDPQPAHMLSRLGAFATRVTLLFALGLPYVMTAVMTYRPRVIPGDPPRRAYETVAFTASDGTALSGWFIPADSTRPGDAPAWWGQRTLLICHGLASNKSNHLVLGQWGPQAGYNVLIFDHRAHGQSAGQLTTFGLRESLDVLAAVKWLKAARPEQSQKVFGIGASMGAAALITAAADRSPEGQAIDAVVVYGTFARLDGLSAAVAREHFVWPLSTLVKYIAAPLANVQTGYRLTAFAPADDIARIWPRPVMIIHGLGDEVIPFEQAEALNQAATHPKRFRPVERAGHNDVIEAPQVIDEVQHFLLHADPDPVI